MWQVERTLPAAPYLTYLLIRETPKFVQKAYIYENADSLLKSVNGIYSIISEKRSNVSSGPNLMSCELSTIRLELE